MARQDLILRIGGEGGEGVISTGELLTTALARASFHIYTFRTYPAEIKGGHAVYQVRASDQILLSHGDQFDVLLAFNQEAYDKHHQGLKPNGVLIYNSDVFTPPADTGFVKYGVPMTKIASEQVNMPLSKNIVALGVMSQLFHIPMEKFEELLREKFGKKGEVVLQKNLAALQAGFDHAKAQLVKQDSYWLKPVETEPHLVLSGNEALILGALVAGCRFYAGYPITPASDILEGLAREMPKVGGAVVQTEDEIAAIGSVIGASFAGKKAMTATSGPGLALMIEFLGLATMTETPCVVVDCQRAGPSTGMPTKHEQSDLEIAIYGRHGDAPRVVIALTSVEDCFYSIIRAFNIAEEYQTPVIVLSDQNLAHRKATIAKPDLSMITAIDRTRPSPEDLQEGYLRYKLTPSGVSPMAVPGLDGVAGCYTATGLEHTEFGAPDYEPETHWTMTEKRHRKLEGVRTLANELCRRYGAEDAEIGVLGWGSSEGVIREAVSQAVAQGIKVAALHPKIMDPMPVERLEAFTAPLRKVIVPEVNFTGQYAKLVRQHLPHADIVPLTRCGGLPLTPADIYQAIVGVTSHQSPVTSSGRGRSNG